MNPERRRGNMNSSYLAAKRRAFIAASATINRIAECHNDDTAKEFGCGLKRIFVEAFGPIIGSFLDAGLHNNALNASLVMR